MRIIIASIFVLILIHPVFAQVISKNEMEAQMQGAVNVLKKEIAELEKQITEAKKNKEDEETIKGLGDQLAMLKKQVAMMGGLNKSLSGISEKTFQRAGERETIIPGKDSVRINTLPQKILSDSGLSIFIRKYMLL